LESIRGIGASETMPPHRFLEMTRRVPIAEVALGGQRYPMNSSARWVDYQITDRDTCATGMRALLGHEYLSEHQVWFDYARGRMKMRKTKAKEPRENGHQVLYDQDLARHGAEQPERALYRAKLLIGIDDVEGAITLLEQLPASISDEERAEARVLLVRLYRHGGDLDKAWEVLSPIAPGDLVEQGEIIGTVNGLLFEERADKALALANAGVLASPDRGDAWVARADVYLYIDEASKAAADLQQAANLEGYPDAHLLRRARVSQAQGDRHGAIAHIRKLLQLYPFAGEFLWFYALLLDEPGDATTFRYDMTYAMDRLHPDMQPIDFQVAANRVLGDQDRAVSLMDEGIAATCDLAPEGTHERDNCLAWFWSLAGVKQDEALRRIDSALSNTGERSDYLDTKAIVHLARGELHLASEAAYKAARLSPDDVYMLWQAERITALRDNQETR
ncbi:MAG: hypothetical protein GWP91_12160, partial [Rhodobacterales bacterium]|nr:hypothetical protein [Rhodobacterales bacterium]